MARSSPPASSPQLHFQCVRRTRPSTLHLIGPSSNCAVPVDDRIPASPSPPSFLCPHSSSSLHLLSNRVVTSSRERLAPFERSLSRESRPSRTKETGDYRKRRRGESPRLAIQSRQSPSTFVPAPRSQRRFSLAFAGEHCRQRTSSQASAAPPPSASSPTKHAMDSPRPALHSILLASLLRPSHFPPLDL